MRGGAAWLLSLVLFWIAIRLAVDIVETLQALR